MKIEKRNDQVTINPAEIFEILADYVHSQTGRKIRAPFVAGEFLQFAEHIGFRAKGNMCITVELEPENEAL